MAEILFYHLTESTLEDALPGLVERTLQRGWRAVVQTASDERRDALDSHLWSYSDESFLAHGKDHEPFAEDQPVLLTSGQDNANNASVRFVVDGAEPPAELGAYERVVFLFDGHDSAQVDAARVHWKTSKAAGHPATYWQQTPDRRWERKA
jgi:DNA polymerase-3 subunit chi